ncbi:hypothetical protein [Vibrio vulnificus]|uniref:Uncharacterized protein n=1 Tax=Vibrio vulnificus TaxID=672 RepID=A0AAW4HFA8_VIBVL|nr:hypothetical protein [Vibrio vulnificus]MBN8123181.1 hypothetical protein [Vibrio vulnificus]
MSRKITTSLPIGKDSHTLVLEAREMVGGLAAIAGASSGAVETLTAEQLFFLFQAVGEKLDVALALLESE